ncbi:hypothetical protein ABK040_001261 [Willaertia magna]
MGNSIQTFDIYDSPPLRKANTNAILLLCDHFKYENKKVRKLIKEQQLVGSVFTEYSQKYLGQKKVNSLLAEKEDLALNLTQLLQCSQSLMKEFIEQVIDKKLDIEKEIMIKAGDSFLLTDNNLTVRENHVKGTSSIETTSKSIYGEDNNDISFLCEYNSALIIDESNLDEVEKERIEKVKEKLTSFYLNPKTNLDSLKKSYGLSGLVEADAQSLVCKDKFLYNFFGNTIRTPKLSKDLRNTEREAFINVKLVVSVVKTTDIERTLAILAPNQICHTVWGVTHTSILIGQYKIDWFNDSLVMIKNSSHSSSEAIIAIDLGKFTTKEQIEQAFQTITDISTKYNGDKTYNNKTCNCQVFTSEILKEFKKINPEVTIPKNKSSLGKYFKELKKGEIRKIFYYNDELKKLIKNSKKEEKYSNFYDNDSIVFNSRREIDVFAYWLDSLGYFSTKTGEVDFYLLKAFDRAFCLQNENELSDILVVNGVECSFFTTHGTGKRDDISIIKMEYNTQDLNIPFPSRLFTRPSKLL